MNQAFPGEAIQERGIPEHLVAFNPPRKKKKISYGVYGVDNGGHSSSVLAAVMRR